MHYTAYATPPPPMQKKLRGFSTIPIKSCLTLKVEKIYAPSLFQKLTVDLFNNSVSCLTSLAKCTAFCSF
jgi:hypothetical protein